MSSTIIEQIKSRLDIVDIISGYIKVEKSGVNWKAKCPFHNEKTPSFYISGTRQNFYCFGCHEKGDVISFVQKIEGLEFKEALENLAIKAGVEIKKSDWKKPKENKERLYDALEETTLIFEENLKDRRDVVLYLEKRGLKKDSIKKWRLGVAKDEWRSLMDIMQNKNFSKEELIKAGLVKKVLDEEKYYDTFRDRIIFPIFDNSNRVIAFSGRTLKNDPKVPKYLNSPESELFYKSDVLYGLNYARDYIRKLDYTILVEGQMDLILAHEAGTKNTVATSGTAVTLLHLKKLQRLSNRIVIAYDGDSAGDKAGKQACLMALSLGMSVKIAKLANDEDPASIIQNDPKIWEKQIKDSEYFTDYILKNTLSQKTEREVLNLVRTNVLPTIKAIESDIERSRYIKKVATALRVDEGSIIKDLSKIKSYEKELSESDVSINNKSVDNINIYKIVASIIFAEENVGEYNTKNKYEKIAGKEKLEELINKYQDDKEALLFEVELYGIDIKNDKTKTEIINRIELEIYKNKSYEIAKKLDNKNLNKDDEGKLKKQYIELEENIKKLNSLT